MIVFEQIQDVHMTAVGLEVMDSPPGYTACNNEQKFKKNQR